MMKAGKVRHLVKSILKDGSIQLANGLPREILFMIFSYLDASSLCAVCAVNKLWRVTALDRRLWLPIYCGTVKKSNNVPLPDNLKLAVVHAAISKQGIQCSKMRRHVDSLSGSVSLHKDFIEKLGPTFYLEWIQKNGSIHSCSHADAFAFKSTILIRFICNYSDLPLDHIGHVKIRATTPIFAGSKWPNRSAIISEMSFQNNLLNATNMVASDELVSLYKVYENFAVAFWNNNKSEGDKISGENVAFALISLPSHKLVERCLNGCQNSLTLQKPLKPLNTTLDALVNELSRFSCFFELHNSRESFWTEKTNPKVFQEGNSAVLVVINRDSPNTSWPVHKDSLDFLWKTELFKGKIKNLCFLDFVMLDTENNPIKLFSSLAKSEEIHSKTYDYSDGKMMRLVAGDVSCEVLIEIFQEVVPEQKSFIRHVQVKIFDVAAIYDGKTNKKPPTDNKTLKKLEPPQNLNEEMAAYVQLFNENNNNSSGLDNITTNNNSLRSNTSSSSASSTKRGKNAPQSFLYKSPPNEKW